MTDSRKSLSELLTQLSQAQQGSRKPSDPMFILEIIKSYDDCGGVHCNSAFADCHGLALFDLKRRNLIEITLGGILAITSKGYAALRAREGDGQ